MVKIYFNDNSATFQADNVEIHKDKLVIELKDEIIAIFNMDKIIGYVRY